MCKSLQKFVQTLQKKLSWFLFSQNECDSLTTPLPVVGHAPHVNQKKNTHGHLTMKCISKLVQQLPIFLLRGWCLCNYETINTGTVGKKLACWTEGFTLLIWVRQLWSISNGFIGILCSSQHSVRMLRPLATSMRGALHWQQGRCGGHPQMFVSLSVNVTGSLPIGCIVVPFTAHAISLQR